MAGLTFVAHVRAEGDPLDNWHLRNPLLHIDQLTDVAYGNGVFVAASGDAGAPADLILSSPDGVFWATHDLDPEDIFGLGRIRDLTYGQDTFVALGEGGMILQSDPLSDTPPAIVRQPRSRIARIGESAYLCVSAVGSSPLSHEWFENGQPLCVGAVPTLLFDFVEPSDAGDYQVAVRNAFGSVISAVARLTVEPDQPILSLRFDALARLTILGRHGASYQIECQDELNPESEWRVPATVFLPTPPIIWTDLESAFMPRRLYRVLELP